LGLQEDIKMFQKKRTGSPKPIRILLWDHYATGESKWSGGEKGGNKYGRSGQKILPSGPKRWCPKYRGREGGAERKPILSGIVKAGSRPKKRCVAEIGRSERERGEETLPSPDPNIYRRERGGS